jgi:hypothetical protein
MEKIHTSEADRSSASQEIPRILSKQGSLQHSQEPSTVTELSHNNTLSVLLSLSLQILLQLSNLNILRKTQHREFD